MSPSPRAQQDAQLKQRLLDPLWVVRNLMRVKGFEAKPVDADWDKIDPHLKREMAAFIDDPAEVARQMTAGLKAVKQFRRERNDAFHFNWLLKIDEGFQRPFDPTHENMASLQLRLDLPAHERAANLRRAFSGIVAGNVKDMGIRLIEEHGPYEIHGDAVSAIASASADNPSAIIVDGAVAPRSG